VALSSDEPANHFEAIINGRNNPVAAKSAVISSMDDFEETGDPLPNCGLRKELPLGLQVLRTKTNAIRQLKTGSV
jgi:hypothetical protein